MLVKLTRIHLYWQNTDTRSPVYTIMSIHCVGFWSESRSGECGMCRLCPCLSYKQMFGSQWGLRKTVYSALGHMGERVWSKLLLLNAADGLDLRGLAVGAKLSEVLVLPAVTIALHDVLVSTITGVLVAHKSVVKSQREEEVHVKSRQKSCARRPGTTARLSQ